MAEVIAKREIRRRRILENSERRLQKIIGKNEQNEFEGTSNNSTTNNIQINTLEHDTIENSVDKEVNRSDNCRSTISTGDDVFEEIINNIDPLFELEENNAALSTLNNFHKHTDESNTTYDLAKKTNNSEVFDNNDETANDLQTKSIVTNCFDNNLCTTKELFPFNLLSNCLCYIILAIIVNILLICKLDNLFGKAITIPYFMVTLGRLCTYNNFQDTHNGSLLIAALILCNIKPEWTYKFKTAMNLFNLIITDLALYIFSFTLIYFVMVHYLQNFDILFATNILSK